jgi:hypothetical protein
MADGFSIDDQRHILARITAYREVCNQVRRSSNGTLIFGLIMFGLWYMIFGQRNDYGIFSLCYLVLASLELGVGLVNRLFPSAEGVLFDGMVLLAFGGANLFRSYIIWQAGFQPPIISLIFGAYWLWTGASHVRSYFELLKIFSPRPTSEHLRWYAGLLRDIRKANPQEDPSALDFPSNPPIRALLLGSVAMFVEASSDEIVLFDREDVRLTPQEVHPSSSQRLAVLSLGGTRLEPFVLDPDNWRNYADWKRSGGETIPSLNMT